MEAWAIQGGIHMYKYVDRQQVQRYDRKCRTILEKLRQVLREDYGIISQISLVGSGARDLVTRNGKGSFDLDYNLILQSSPEEFDHDLAGLKRVIRETLDSISRGGKLFLRTRFSLSSYHFGIRSPHQASCVSR